MKVYVRDQSLIALTHILRLWPSNICDQALVTVVNYHGCLVTVAYVP